MGRADPIDQGAPAPWMWRWYGALTTYLGPIIVAAWICVCVAAAGLLPDFSSSQGAGLLQLIPGNAPALQAESLETHLFGSSLAETQAVVVEHGTGALPLAVEEQIVARALAVDRRSSDAGAAGSPAFALPVVNVAQALRTPGLGSTTAVTYLGFPASIDAANVDSGAQAYARSLPHPAGAQVGVTGAVPAQVDEGNLIDSALLPVEVISVLVIALLVAVVFRSPIAPVVPLTGTAVAYVVTHHVIGWVARQLGVEVPAQLDPVMVVLLLGVVTDYSIFSLTGMRARLVAGERRTAAARRTAARVVPLVAAAALTVAAGTVALIGTDVDFFHALGPGLAASVIIAGLVATTFVPGLVAMLGRAAFWPSLRRAVLSAPAGAPAAVSSSPSLRRRFARLLTRRAVAAVAVLVCLAGLAAAGTGLLRIRLGSDLLSQLPASSGPRSAAIAAETGFTGGIVAPTALILQAPGIGSGSDSAAVARLQGVIEASPGVAAAIGPAQLPAGTSLPVFTDAGGDAVRIMVLFSSDPYDGPAITAFTSLQARVQAALPDEGLGGASASWSGGTPAAADAVAGSTDDLWRVAILAGGLMALVLILYFRAILAPLLLILCSAAALAAPLGLLVYVFQGLIGAPDITFFVPLAGGVLLVSLGADYSVFVMGGIWEEARTASMSEAVAMALPRASRAVSIAAFTLAASFAVLAVVPVAPFQELAFMMSVGVLIDAFVVRSFLLPGLLVLIGPCVFWPHRR